MTDSEKSKVPVDYKDSKLTRRDNEQLFEILKKKISSGLYGTKYDAVLKNMEAKTPDGNVIFLFIRYLVSELYFDQFN